MEPALPKILVLSGSTRSGSLNAKLAALAARELPALGAEATLISLADYSLPLYDGDLDKAQGPLPESLKLRETFAAHQGVFIASPEYNASVTPLLKNTLDWLGNARLGDEPSLAAYQNRAFAIGAASPGPSAGIQSLLALRQILAVGCRALVVAEQVAVPFAKGAFDDDGNLKDPGLTAQLRLILGKLVALAATQKVGR
ncbi:MAG TPA: NAD(P)H-dependent oxidoreductase [Xanthobacteraceae bacterium]|nr:NAD(P)H-dependent oxidoreductase [Xanthobacteraceae bacterium]